MSKSVQVWHQVGFYEPACEIGMSAMSLNVIRNVDAIHPRYGRAKCTIFTIPEIAVDRAEIVISHFGDEFVIYPQE